ncbi:hypothetical protein DL765_011435 [Monosporascus sp. GIB2]|nr:hypothetical protein DL765_011435 [Monosporascus sp. GIB2]
MIRQLLLPRLAYERPLLSTNTSCQPPISCQPPAAPAAKEQLSEALVPHEQGIVAKDNVLLVQGVVGKGVGAPVDVGAGAAPAVAVAAVALVLVASAPVFVPGALGIAVPSAAGIRQSFLEKVHAAATASIAEKEEKKREGKDEDRGGAADDLLVDASVLPAAPAAIAAHLPSMAVLVSMKMGSMTNGLANGLTNGQPNGQNTGQATSPMAIEESDTIYVAGQDVVRTPAVPNTSGSGTIPAICTKTNYRKHLRTITTAQWKALRCGACQDLLSTLPLLSTSPSGDAERKAEKLMRKANIPQGAGERTPKLHLQPARQESQSTGTGEYDVEKVVNSRLDKRKGAMWLDQIFHGEQRLEHQSWFLDFLSTTLLLSTSTPKHPRRPSPTIRLPDPQPGDARPAPKKPVTRSMPAVAGASSLNRKGGVETGTHSRPVPAEAVVAKTSMAMQNGKTT